MKYFITIVIILTTQAYASNLESILFNRLASIEDREEAYSELSRILDRSQPLPVVEAISELCHGVDHRYRGIALRVVAEGVIHPRQVVNLTAACRPSCGG